MRLMQRPQITTLSLPRSSTWPSDLLPPHQAPFHFLPDVYAFSKFMLATPAYLIEDLSRDLDQLAAERRSLAAMGDDLGITFVDAAEVKVQRQMEAASALETPHLREAVDRAYKDQHEIAQRSAEAKRRQVAQMARSVEPPPLEDIPADFLASQSGLNVNARSFAPSQAPSAPAPSAANGGRNARQRRNLNPPPPSSQTYYYYQAASGLPIFLHPLDIKILHAHFRSYEAFPDMITVRVEASNEGSVDDDLRKRCKYLGHLAEGADVVFVEADLRGVVGAEGLHSFDGALKSRRARRRDKDRRDDKARAKAEERERERHVKEVQTAKVAVGWTDHDYIAPASFERPAIQFEDFPAAEMETTPAQTPAPSGAWGARSFASALHGPAISRPRAANPQRQNPPEDDWDFEGAWDELEQRIAGDSVGGGRRKRGAKMVVLGGSGGGRRR
jgi:hypothetical protein